MKTNNRLFKLILSTFVCLLCFYSQSYADFVYEDGSKNVSKIPVGSSNVNMLSFSLHTTTETQLFDTIRLLNTSEVGYGPDDNQINAVRIYLDEAGNGIIDEEDEIVSGTDHTFTTAPNFIDLNLTPDLEVTTSKSYFIIAYDVGSDVSLGDTTEVVIDSINRNKGVPDELDLSGTASAKNQNIEITGVAFIDSTNIAPEVAIPGQKKIPMLNFKFKIVGEAISEGDSPDIELTIKNEFANFTVSNSDQGVEAVYLYRTATDFDGIPQFNASDDLFDLVAEITSFSDPETLVITDFYDGDFNSVAKDTTQNFYLVYDLTDEMDISENTKIGAQIYSFSAIGDESEGPSRLTWPLSASDRETGIEVDIAGLTLSEISKHVPSNSTIGANLSTSIMRFRLRANHTDIDVNRITILNPGTTPFVTEGTIDDGGVSKVELYLDTIQDNEFSDSDQLIGTVTLAETNAITGLVNQANSVVVPININGDPLTISEYIDSNFVDYPENNERVIFVNYHFSPTVLAREDASGNFTTIAKAQLGTILGTANYTINSLPTSSIVTLSKYDNDNPATANPAAEINLADTTITLTDVESVAPLSVVEGEIKVPMLWLNISSSLEDTISSASFTVRNSKRTFSRVNQGITKIWVYADNDNSKTLSSGDTYLSSTTKFNSTSEAVLKSIPIRPNESSYLILYDIGRNASSVSQNIRAQISNIQSDSGESFTLGAVLPSPQEAASTVVLESRLNPPALILTSQVSAPETTTFSATISVTNDTGTNLVITEVNPKIYLSSIGGTDISYEFNIVKQTSSVLFPLTLAAGNTQAISYQFLHSKAISDGIAYLDASVSYQTANNGTAIVSRYLGQEEWESGVVTPRTFSIRALDNVSFTSFPAYIDSITLLRGGQTVNFRNHDSVLASDKMYINFTEPDAIDTGSISIELNGSTLIRSENEETDTLSYSYDETLGQIAIPFLGDTDGELVISVSDGENSLEPAYIQYDIDSTIKLTRPLFYPNPYILDEGDLTLGFNLSQPGEVTYYFYNHLGSMVQKDSATFSSAGYQEIEFNAFSSFLKPGLYVVMLVSVDDNGNREISHVKLAVR